MLLIGESNEAMCRPSVETSGFNQVLIKQSNRGVTVIIKSFNARTLLVVANSSHARATEAQRRPDLCSGPCSTPPSPSVELRSGSRLRGTMGVLLHVDVGAELPSLTLSSLSIQLLPSPQSNSSPSLSPAPPLIINSAPPLPHRRSSFSPPSPSV
jgi:hypothetical protein